MSELAMIIPIEEQYLEDEPEEVFRRVKEVVRECFLRLNPDGYTHPTYRFLDGCTVGGLSLSERGMVGLQVTAIPL